MKMRTWREFLIEKLAKREEALGYLQVSLEEYLIDRDTPFFLKGVRNVVAAQGGIPEVAKRAGMPPEVLSKFLHSGGPLCLSTLNTVLKALGWCLSIEPLSAESDSAVSDSEPLPPETHAAQTAEAHPA